MEYGALEIVSSLLTLLFLAIGTFFLAKRLKLPYTVLLVVVGLGLIPISHLDQFHFLQSFTLTPGLLFFVFLPTLIFESAYNMNIRNVLQNIRSISLFSIVSLLVSAFFIAFFLDICARWIGFPLPFEVTLLFGALISATDPVAVLSLFKEYGAPKRLSLLFEGESLFNDGTSVAFFLVLLEMFIHQSSGGVDEGLVANLVGGTFTFVVMVLGGILFGGLMGVCFSKIIQQVRDNTFVEITLTMIVAHLTFLLSEVISHNLVIGGQHIYFSSIIATVIAAMVVGNYGRYKISPSVLEYMEHFWGYFAFVANSIIFILIGLLFASLPISLFDIFPIVALAILIVAIGRAISIYPVAQYLNWTKKEEHIPNTWQHLMAWGSLRGALAITMVLLIPDNLTVPGWEYSYTVKEFITALTIACIYFTLFIKGTTIGPMIQKFKLDALNDVESVEYQEAKALIYARVLLEVERFSQKGYIDKSVHHTLREKYQKLYKESCKACMQALKSQVSVPERVLVIYALASAKYSLKTLFIYNEVTESVYKKILNDLTIQLEYAENSRDAVKITLSSYQKDWLDTLYDSMNLLFHRQNEAVDHQTRFMYYRAQAIIMRKAIDELNNLSESDLDIFEDKSLFGELITQLSQHEAYAKEQVDQIKNTHLDIISPLALNFAEAGVQKAKKNLLHTFAEREVVTPKVSSLLLQELTASGHS